MPARTVKSAASSASSAQPQRERIPASSSHNALLTPARTQLAPDAAATSSGRPRSRTQSDLTAGDARPRAQSGSSVGRPEYRYSIGPAPVRFPKPGQSNEDAVSLTESKSAGPSRSRSPNNSVRGRRGSGIPAPPAAMDRQGGSNPRLDSRFSTPQRVASLSPCPPAAAEGSLGAAHLPKQRPRTPSPSRMSKSSVPEPAKGADERALRTLSPPSPPRRRSSRILTLTSFPFPHPTTPKGGAEEETKLLGFLPLPQGVKTRLQWLTLRWAAAGGGGDEEAGTRTDPAQAAEDCPLLRSQAGAMSASQGRNSAAEFPAVASTQAQSRIRQYGSMRSTYSSTTIDSDEPDHTDPYGYRRLAGPDLLPSYHEEHVMPRRRARRSWLRRLRTLLGLYGDDDVSSLRAREEVCTLTRRPLVFGAVAAGLALAMLLGLSWYWFYWLGEHRNDGL
ncbi:unnamed protein product [Parajaminaea phylloscopi]